MNLVVRNMGKETTRLYLSEGKKKSKRAQKPTCRDSQQALGGLLHSGPLISSHTSVCTAQGYFCSQTLTFPN